MYHVHQHSGDPGEAKAEAGAGLAIKRAIRGKLSE